MSKAGGKTRARKQLSVVGVPRARVRIPRSAAAAAAAASDPASRSRLGDGLVEGDPARPEEVPVGRAVDEARVGVPVHERVDLQLRLVEGVLRGRDHVAVDDLADAGVQGHLEMGGRGGQRSVIAQRMMHLFLIR